MPGETALAGGDRDARRTRTPQPDAGRWVGRSDTRFLAGGYPTRPLLHAHDRPWASTRPAAPPARPRATGTLGALRPGTLPARTLSVLSSAVFVCVFVGRRSPRGFHRLDSLFGRFAQSRPTGGRSRFSFPEPEVEDAAVQASAPADAPCRRAAAGCRIRTDPADGRSDGRAYSVHFRPVPAWMDFIVDVVNKEDN